MRLVKPVRELQRRALWPGFVRSGGGGIRPPSVFGRAPAALQAPGASIEGFESCAYFSLSTLLNTMFLIPCL